MLVSMYVIADRTKHRAWRLLTKFFRHKFDAGAELWFMVVAYIPTLAVKTRFTM